MKKLLPATLVVALFFSIVYSTIGNIGVSASGESSDNFGITKETLTVSTKTYEFKYPTGVDRILPTGYKLEGDGEITAFLPDSTNRKLTVTVKGKNTSVAT